MIFKPFSLSLSKGSSNPGRLRQAQSERREGICLIVQATAIANAIGLRMLLATGE